MCAACVDLQGMSGTEPNAARSTEPSNQPRALDNDEDASLDAAVPAAVSTADADSGQGAADTRDAGDAGDAAAHPYLVNDHFETQIDCDGWTAHNGNAEPMSGGFESPRACSICKDGDIYVDKLVPLPARGRVVFELKAKRTTAPLGTRLYLHEIFHNAESENAYVNPTLTDAWIDARLVYTMQNDAQSLTVRIRLDNGCMLVDDVHVWVE